MDKIVYYNTHLTELNKSLRDNLITSNKVMYSPTLSEKIQLKMDIFLVNAKMYPYKNIYSLPWNIKFFKTKFNIENNYPHTHHNIIFFPQTFFKLNKSERLNLLVHEKLHIYQRYFPIQYHMILFNKFGLQVKQLLKTHEDYQMVRQNPDNNLLIYTDNGQYTLPIFKDNPYTIRDVKFIDYDTHDTITEYSKLNKNEHPNETFAYFITNAIIQGNTISSIQPFL